MGPIAKKLSTDLRTSGIARALGADAQRPIPKEMGEDLPSSQSAWMRSYGTLASVGFALVERHALRATRLRFRELEAAYMPGGPPMSPVTDSYFMTWQTCDFRVGGSETLATIAVELAPQLGLRHLQDEFRTLGRSYNGLYEVQSRSSECTTVVDLVTGDTCEVEFADRLPAEPGTLWWARLLPPTEGARFWTAISTPYILVGDGIAKEWTAYLDRALAGAPPGERPRRYLEHMKAGPHPTYWLDYVLDGYAGVDSVAVFLTGVPDRPSTLPHALESEGATPVLSPDTPPHLRVRARLAALAEETGALEAAVDLCAQACGAEDQIPRDTDGRWHPLVHAFAALGLLDDDDTSLLEELSKRTDLPGDEREIIAELLEGCFSVFEVLQIEIDERIEVRDLFRRRRFWVSEQLATRGLALGDMLAGWIQVRGDRITFEGALAHVPRLLAGAFGADALGLRDLVGAEYPRLPAKKRAGLLVPSILGALATLLRERPAPRLLNTEGDELLVSEAHYTFTERDRVLERLSDSELGEPDGDVFHMLSDDGSVLVARIELHADELIVSTNSKARLDRVKAWIARTVGRLVKHRIDTFEDPASTARPPAEAAPDPRPIPPEAQAALRELVEHHLARWIDEPVPALDGKTPRQAVKSKRGKNHVKVLLLEQERLMSNHPQLDEPIDFRPFWAQLGLEYPAPRA